MNFIRVSSRLNAPILVARSLKGSTSTVLQPLINILPTQHKVVPNTTYGRWDQSQKQMMIGLGCSVFIDLCAEAMFFKKVPYSAYKESLEMVQSNELVQARIGKNIVRKGNKFGLWPNREGGRKIMVAHYYVQGDKGEAKIILHVEKRHLVYAPTLLQVEFSNAERLTLLEEEDPQPSIMPAL